MEENIHDINSLIHKLNKYEYKLSLEPENVIYQQKYQYYYDLVGGGKIGDVFKSAKRLFKKEIPEQQIVIPTNGQNLGITVDIFKKYILTNHELIKKANDFNIDLTKYDKFNKNIHIPIQKIIIENINKGDIKMEIEEKEISIDHFNIYIGEFFTQIKVLNNDKNITSICNKIFDSIKNNQEILRMLRQFIIYTINIIDCRKFSGNKKPEETELLRIINCKGLEYLSFKSSESSDKFNNYIIGLIEKSINAAKIDLLTSNKCLNNYFYDYIIEKIN